MDVIVRTPCDVRGTVGGRGILRGVSAADRSAHFAQGDKFLKFVRGLLELLWSGERDD